MLTLPIKKQWFDLIKIREKKEEYRERTPYYESRFRKYLGQKITVAFRNGYNLNSPTIICDVIPRIKTGREEWGAVGNTLYYTLEILNVVF